MRTKAPHCGAFFCQLPARNRHRLTRAGTQHPGVRGAGGNAAYTRRLARLRASSPRPARLKPTALVPLLLACLAMADAHAQAAQPAVAASEVPPPEDVAAPPADIEFGATVQMQSLRLEGTPQLRVELLGDAAGTRQDTEREGLPTPVKGGTTYRNVTVRTTIRASVSDPDHGAVARASLLNVSKASP